MARETTPPERAGDAGVTIIGRGHYRTSCQRCGRDGPVAEVRTLREAVAAFEREGWRLHGGRWTCPACGEAPVDGGYR